MSTGRRLAKRSIIGTKVCAPGPDGLWYSGVIQDVKTLPTSTITMATINEDVQNDTNMHDELNDNIDNSKTKYIVRFDFKTMQGLETLSSTSHTPYMSNSGNNNIMASPKSVIMEARRVYASPAQTLRRNAMIKEFRESDLIGPGFRSIMGRQLQPGQRVFLTYNGRETSGDVLSHDTEKDEVAVKILAMGNEEPIELKIRLEEVRLLESRRSARLADQDRDTDFARLADMSGDRRRTSHSVEVPMPMTPQNNPRKRPPSYTNDYNEEQKVEMDECNAALILMKLSNTPKSQIINGEIHLASSPYSSSPSWSSGSSSPPLSDDGYAQMHTSILTDAAASARNRTVSVSTSDEGIDVDYPRRKRASKSRFKCTYPQCNHTYSVQLKIEKHIRNDHLGNKKQRRDESDGEEEFYYTEIEDDDDDVKPSPTSPTFSHMDMARPPHEDPEYQRKIAGISKQGRVISQQHHNNGFKSEHHNNAGPQYHQLQTQQQQQLQNNNTICMPTSSPLAYHNYTWPSPNNNNNNNSNVVQSSPILQHQQLAQQQQQHHNNNTATLIKRVHSSPRPSQAVTATAPYLSPPQPAYVQHQLSQPNVTVTVTTSPNHQQQQQHNTNGSHHHQQQHQQQQQPTGAMTITSTTTHAANNNYHSQQQQHHSIQHHQQQHSPNGHSNYINSNNAQHMLQQQHTAAINNTVRHTPNNNNNISNNNNNSPPNRRTRGENKKCRKVYGMQRRDQWCTQCKWKKACSRFGD